MIYLCDTFINLITKLKKRLLICKGSWEECESRRGSQEGINSTDTLLINERLQKIFCSLLKKLWGKGNSHQLLVEVQIFTAAIEISMVVPQEGGNRFDSRPAYTSL